MKYKISGKNFGNIFSDMIKIFLFNNQLFLKNSKKVPGGVIKKTFYTISSKASQQSRQITSLESFHRRDQNNKKAYDDHIMVYRSVYAIYLAQLVDADGVLYYVVLL
ncbi:hypothetical protein CCPUN_09320 [Cardinium endosymbiont of Culicoides punctatus]|nr:hypothetical protein CCPUN_09320 [Cardinium endosymbiont of Culicoides punctatus]